MQSRDEAGRGEELSDPALHDEIELLGELLETVALADRPLEQADIDRALRVTTQPPGERGRPVHPEG